MSYIIQTFILVDDESGVTYDTLDEAISERENLEAMQPENQYFIQEVTDE